MAPRRSEHVACADGASVLAAGEIGFTSQAGSWSVTCVSNQSAGYCPVCTEVDIVRDGHFVCVFCDAELPTTWNIVP